MTVGLTPVSSLGAWPVEVPCQAGFKIGACAGVYLVPCSSTSGPPLSCFTLGLRQLSYGTCKRAVILRSSCAVLVVRGVCRLGHEHLLWGLVPLLLSFLSHVLHWGCVSCHIVLVKEL